MTQDRFLWFNKLSLECNVNFELIGSLLALAIYNSILLPAPFPKVIYKKLLNEQVCLEVDTNKRRISKNSSQTYMQL